MRLILFLPLLFSGLAWSQLKPQTTPPPCDASVLEQELKSAKTLLYYSMFTSNSRDELELVQAKLNVAEDLMNCGGLSPLEARDFDGRLQRMKRDVRSRLEIGRENLKRLNGLERNKL
jgi:hypothetical protein